RVRVRVRGFRDSGGRRRLFGRRVNFSAWTVRRPTRSRLRSRRRLTAPSSGRAGFARASVCVADLGRSWSSRRPAPKLQPVDGTKADEIALALEEAIVSGELEPGTVLRQEQVSSQYAVSRTPVREALR